ncbi:MAG: hypothetical protein HY777_11905 [Betaproteobacteria bacterium]|nr:hypothetical protein [Betaproteobacteria bacterium]
MKTLFALLAMFAFAGSAIAADAACETKAAEKKLAGAAKNSFMKKCEADAGANACAATAAEKKLAGAAKNSFMKKCEADAKAAH